MAAETMYSSLRENLATVLDRVVDRQEVVVVRRKGSRDVALIPAIRARRFDRDHPFTKVATERPPFADRSASSRNGARSSPRPLPDRSAVLRIPFEGAAKPEDSDICLQVAALDGVPRSSTNFGSDHGAIPHGTPRFR